MHDSRRQLLTRLTRDFLRRSTVATVEHRRLGQHGALFVLCPEHGVEQVGVCRCPRCERNRGN